MHSLAKCNKGTGHKTNSVTKLQQKLITNLILGLIHFLPSL